MFRLLRSIGARLPLLGVSEAGPSLQQVPPRAGTSKARFSARFAQKVERFCALVEAREKSGADNIGLQTQILNSMRAHLSVDVFHYQNTADEVKGKKLLVHLCGVLLASLRHVPCKLRGQRFDLVLRLLTRYEFDLVHILRGKPSQIEEDDEKSSVAHPRPDMGTTSYVGQVDGGSRASLSRAPADLELVGRYRTNLLSAVEVALQTLENGGFPVAPSSSPDAPCSPPLHAHDYEHEQPAPITHFPLDEQARVFAMRVMALAMFRLPSMRHPLLSAAMQDYNEVHGTLRGIALAQRIHTSTDRRSDREEVDEVRRRDALQTPPISSVSSGSRSHSSSPVPVDRCGHIDRTPVAFEPVPTGRSDSDSSGVEECCGGGAQVRSASNTDTASSSIPRLSRFSRGGWRMVIFDQLRGVAQKQWLANRAAVSSTMLFMDHNPSLFLWSSFPPVEREPSVAARAGAVLYDALGDPSTFCWFFSGVLTHVAEHVHGDVHWSLVPGYWTLLAVYLHHLLHSTGPHPNEFLDCADLVLANVPLLPVITHALLRSTSAFNKMGVNQLFDTLDRWFCMATESSTSPLPAAFCYDVLFDALRILLHSPHFQVLIKTLWFIFAHADRFVGIHREHLFLELLIGENHSECCREPSQRQPPSSATPRQLPRAPHASLPIRRGPQRSASFSTFSTLTSRTASSLTLPRGQPPLPLQRVVQTRVRGALSSGSQCSKSRSCTSPFFHLFLHWCPEVRRVFMLVLLYKSQRALGRHKLLLFSCDRSAASSRRSSIGSDLGVTAAASTAHSATSVSSNNQSKRTSGASTGQRSAGRLQRWRHNARKVASIYPVTMVRSLSSSIVGRVSIAASSLWSGLDTTIRSMAPSSDSKTSLTPFTSESDDIPRGAASEVVPVGNDHAPTPAAVASTEPSLDACVELSMALTAEDMTLDGFIWDEIVHHLTIVSHQLQCHRRVSEPVVSSDAPAVYCVPAQLLAYASTALQEWGLHRNAFCRLQRHSRAHGIVTPELYFEIAPDLVDMAPPAAADAPRTPSPIVCASMDTVDSSTAPANRPPSPHIGRTRQSQKTPTSPLSRAAWTAWAQDCPSPRPPTSDVVQWLDLHQANERTV